MVIREFEENPLQKIVLQVETDIVCKNCPNNESGICTSKDKVERYDRGVLEACGLSEGTEISYEKFLKKVREFVIETGRREEICGDCSWDYICRNKSVNRICD